MDKSYINYNAKGEATTFSGDAATDLFRAAVLMSAMGLYKVGISPGRNCMTGPQALKDATRYTGKTYKRGQYDEAKADLQIFVQMRKKHIPAIHEGEK